MSSEKAPAMSDVYELDGYTDSIQTTRAGTAHVETGGVDQRVTDVPMQVEAEHSNGEVWLSVEQAIPGDGTTASATCYLSPEQCDDLADALRENSQIRLFTDHANVWVTMGWLNIDGVGSSDTTKGEVEYATGSLSVMTVVEGQRGGSVFGAVQLTDAEREWLATSLIVEAATAREHEPTTTMNTQPTTRRRRMIEIAASLGIGLTIAGLVFVSVMNEVASLDPERIETVGTMPPLPSLAVALLVIWVAVLIVGLNNGDVMGGAGR